MPAISYIGSTISCVVGVPGTIDFAGFNALTYQLIGKIASFGNIGDTSGDIPVDLLEGRIEHVNGAPDGGEIPFVFRYNIGDVGQNILIAQNNGQNEVSFKIVDTDGKIAFFFGKVANVRDRERTPSNYKGMEGVVRVNSATIRT